MTFRFKMWNALEDTQAIREFYNTSHIIREVNEYSECIKNEFQKQSKYTDEKEYIYFCINRDFTKKPKKQ